MSKRELKKYVKTLKRAHLEEQILSLYDKFKPVKTYYDFVFNPKEDKLLEDAKVKISKEYFPLTTRKPKKRRSVAQKIIKEYLLLGVNPMLIAEIMIYNIEVAQSYTKENYIGQDSFYVSMFNAFRQAVQYMKHEGVYNDFESRVSRITQETQEQKWINSQAFIYAMDES